MTRRDWTIFVAGSAGAIITAAGIVTGAELARRSTLTAADVAPWEPTAEQIGVARRLDYQADGYPIPVWAAEALDRCECSIHGRDVDDEEKAMAAYLEQRTRYLERARGWDR